MQNFDTDIQNTGRKDLQKEVSWLREGIREHRDQVGDDRCWLDDVLLHGLLPDTPPPPATLPLWEEMERRCKQFFENRQCPGCPHTMPAMQKFPESLDADLAQMNEEALQKEALWLRKGIRAHRDRGDARTYQDDERLYSLLPDNVPGNTKLTGDAFLPSCRRFWETRQNQQTQKLHEW